MSSIQPGAAGARAYYTLMQNPSAQTISLGSADALKAAAGNEVFRRKMLEGFLTGGDFIDDQGQEQFLIGIDRADGEDGLSGAELALATQSTLQEVRARFGVGEGQSLTVDDAIARLDALDKADGQPDLVIRRGSLDAAGRNNLIEAVQAKYSAWVGGDKGEIVDCANSRTIQHTYTVGKGEGLMTIARNLLNNKEVRQKIEVKYGTKNAKQLEQKIMADLKTYIQAHPEVGGSSKNSKGERVTYFYNDATFLIDDALGLSSKTGAVSVPQDGGKKTVPPKKSASGKDSPPPSSGATSANPSGVTTESPTIKTVTPNTGALNFDMKALVSQYVGKYPALAKYAGLLERYATVQQGKRGYSESYARQLIERLAPQLVLIEQEALRQGVPPKLAVATVIQESGAKANAVSGCGAKGPWQFMPGTARDMGLTVGDGVDERTDWRKSTRAAMKYLRCLLDKYDGDARCALAAYNWGSGNVAKLKKGTKTMPAETRKYTSEIPYYVGNVNDWS